MNTSFWFIAGMLTGLAAAFVVVPLWRERLSKLRAQHYAVGVCALVAFGAIAVLLYRHYGRPDLLLATPAPAIAAYEQQVRTDPRDAASWLALAGLYRQQRDFASARKAFARLSELNAMTPDAWADYADVLGSLAGGSLAGEAAQALDRALALDPRHAKALWLKASLAHEQRRYSEALSLWQQLREQLPAESPDARIVTANLAEAAQLAKQPAPAPQTASIAAAMPVAIDGTVAIERKFSDRIAPGSVLFIYAKAADAPGPPLAVLRMPVGSWPVSFRLDDSLAMIPGRKLSSFERVIVEARISRSGQATRSAGDLYALSPTLQPALNKKLALLISHEIG